MTVSFALIFHFKIGIYQTIFQISKVTFFDKECYICSIEDLIISKLQWYNITPSEKQMEELKFLLLDKNLNIEYIIGWIQKLGSAK